MDEQELPPIEAPAAAPEPAAPEPPAPPAKKARRLPFSPKAMQGFAVLAVVVAVSLLVTSIVYLRPPTDALVRRIVGVIPFPAAVVGNDVVTIRAYLDERDALNTYFQTTAAQGGTAPTETEITANIMDTLVHKAAVTHLAKDANVTLDPARVDAFYQQAVGATDPAQFETQLQTMFGWTADEFRARIVAPVVLATQVSETIAADGSLQTDRKQKAQAAADRVAAGEDFAKVAGDTSADSSSQQGGDVGYVKMADVPDEWKAAITALQIGQASSVVEGPQSFMVFRVTDRITSADDTQVKLSLISVPKVTLDERVQDYLKSVRLWKFVGRT